jgi:hypothetical protein
MREPVTLVPGAMPTAPLPSPIPFSDAYVVSPSISRMLLAAFHPIAEIQTATLPAACTEAGSVCPSARADIGELRSQSLVHAWKIAHLPRRIP